MLIDFSVTNFKSIKEKQTISMIPAAKVKELPDNVFQKGNQHLLTSAVIYGKNASGKSNLLKAFTELLYMVGMSGSTQNGKLIDRCTPFFLDPDTIKRPVEIEINFIAKNFKRYNYQFTFNRFEILHEALYVYYSKKPTKLFLREKDKTIEFSESLKGFLTKEVEKATYPNQLFLSKIGSFKIDELVIPYNEIVQDIIPNTILESFSDNIFLSNIISLIKDKKNENLKEKLNQLLRIADTGISNINLKEDKNTKNKTVSYSQPLNNIFGVNDELNLTHKVYKDDEFIGELPFMFEDESTGTKKLLWVGGLILNALENGSLIIIDELDKSLHPHLTKTLIKFFNSPKTNPKGAQLIFASHDATLLTGDLFRRDQIWFAEKEANGSSYYYALSDLKDVRSSVPFEKYYLKGAFGATPMIDEFELANL